MSIFLAVSGSRPDELKPLLDAAASALADEVPGAVLQRFEFPGLGLVCAPLGLHGPQTHGSSGDGRIAVLAGDPVLVPEGARPSRAEILDRYASEPLAPLLRQSHGTFCGVRLDPTRRSLEAFTDKLGVRPLLTGQHGELRYATNAYWLLQRLSRHLALTADPQGIIETACMTYPLAQRTRYQGVRAGDGGELLQLSAVGPQIECYHDWLDLPALASPPDAATLAASFRQAVDDRLGDAAEQTAFLSGGMDSRLIAACLAGSGRRLNTLNFAPPGSQDLAFGRLAAEALGSQHFEFPLGPDNFDAKQIRILEAWQAQGGPKDFDRRIWSGDGGSVGLGMVYLDAQTTALAGERRYVEAAKRLCVRGRWGMPHRILKSRYRALAAQLPAEIAREMQRWDPLPSKAAYLFLMLNDQRRHLVGHFETVHRKGFDLVLPFFDARFIAVVLATPNEVLLDHRVYNRMLLDLPGPIAQVPWQSYPGHEPCPLPVPQDLQLRYQWDACYDEDDTRMLRDQHTALCLRSAMRPGSAMLSRTNLLVAWLITKSGLRDQSFYGRYAEAVELAAR